jgi:hypothetical protein
VSAADLEAGINVRLTNTGTDAWPADLHLLSGWGTGDQPYLRAAPETLGELALEVPPLAPGESVLVLLAASPAPGGGGILWVTLSGGDAALSGLGSAPLQVRTTGP